MNWAPLYYIWHWLKPRWGSFQLGATMWIAGMKHGRTFSSQSLWWQPTSFSTIIRPILTACSPLASHQFMSMPQKPLIIRPITSSLFYTMHPFLISFHFLNLTILFSQQGLCMQSLCLSSSSCIQVSIQAMPPPNRSGLTCCIRRSQTPCFNHNILFYHVHIICTIWKFLLFYYLVFTARCKLDVREQRSCSFSIT